MTGRKRWLITAGALVGFIAATLVGGAAATPATAQESAQSPITNQTFAADSGDACPMGFTKGTLDWYVGPLRAVNVRGILVDRPLLSDVIVGCGEDRRFTAATFTAYSRATAVTSTTVRVDNDVRDFAFALTAPVVIDLLVVQVCRHSRLSGKPDYCGQPKKYTPIIIAA